MQVLYTVATLTHTHRLTHTHSWTSWNLKESQGSMEQPLALRVCYNKLILHCQHPVQSAVPADFKPSEQAFK